MDGVKDLAAIIGLHNALRTAQSESTASNAAGGREKRMAS